MPGKSSIGFSGFEKLTFLVEISKFSKISEIPKKIQGSAPALRVIRAGTRLTVHRSLPYWCSRDICPDPTEFIPGHLLWRDGFVEIKKQPQLGDCHEWVGDRFRV